MVHLTSSGTVGGTFRVVARIVGRTGIEPVFRRFKKPLQSQRLLPTRGPTPWNRTRTSRASAGRADLLRESGMTSARAPVLRMQPGERR